MSNISELRERIAELEARLVIVEAELFRSDKKPQIQDLSSDMIRVEEQDDFETRTRIGYKK